jgi:hypothetical protein
MENSIGKETEFDFLSVSEVKNCFAELNNDLLRGKHLLSSGNVMLFALLDQYEENFRFYYESLYGLQLEKRSYDGVSYFYLEFPPGSKGRLTNPNNYYELEAKITIVGLILANFYYANYFSFDKQFGWSDIKYEIESGEHKDAYQRLLFNELKADYTDNQWSDVRRLFSSAINFFDRICLVEKIDNSEEMEFIILPTIHRIIDLYKAEIEDIDNFLSDIKMPS